MWLGADIDGIVEWFLEHQLPDGGWNCEWVDGSTRSSFHSTLNSLKGLLAYDAEIGGADATGAARRAGQEYLLQRGLFRRLSTGEPVAPWVGHFVYPFRWTYSVLDAADYFRQASLLDEVAPDPRMADAIELHVEHLDSKKNWLLRRSKLGSLIGETTMCELLARNPKGGMGNPSPSLGLIKPTDIETSVVDGDPWSPAEQAKVNHASEPDLFRTSMVPLEPAPYAIRYKYRCAAAKCPGHDQKNLDWGSGRPVVDGRPSTATPVPARRC